MAELKSVSIRK